MTQTLVKLRFNAWLVVPGAPDFELYYVSDGISN